MPLVWPHGTTWDIWPTVPFRDIPPENFLVLLGDCWLVTSWTCPCRNDETCVMDIGIVCVCAIRKMQAELPVHQWSRSRHQPTSANHIQWEAKKAAREGLPLIHPSVAVFRSTNRVAATVMSPGTRFSIFHHQLGGPGPLSSCNGLGHSCNCHHFHHQPSRTEDAAGALSAPISSEVSAVSPGGETQHDHWWGQGTAPPLLDASHRRISRSGLMMAKKASHFDLD